jgi:hypothetical protein
MTNKPAGEPNYLYRFVDAANEIIKDAFPDNLEKYPNLREALADKIAGALRVQHQNDRASFLAIVSKLYGPTTFDDILEGLVEAEQETARKYGQGETDLEY